MIGRPVREPRTARLFTAGIGFGIGSPLHRATDIVALRY
jgi:hypothetical protein